MKNLKQKITNWNRAKTLARAIGVGTIAATQIITPIAQVAYAEEQNQDAKRLVNRLANLPSQPDHLKKRTARILIDAYSVGKIYGVTRTENRDGSVSSRAEGYLNTNQRCAGIQELYNCAKDRFAEQLNGKYQTNIGLSVLAEKATNCGCK